MKLQLKDKVVLVTGAGKEIGEAISVALSHEGAVPIIVGHDDIASKTAITGQGGTSGYASFKGALLALANPQQKLDEIISKIPLGKRMRLREEIVAMWNFFGFPNAPGISPASICLWAAVTRISIVL